MTDWMPGARQSPQAGGVPLDTSLPPRVVWHITWDALTNGAQPQPSAVSSYLKNVGYCPHLMWNPFTGDVEQYYPASVGGRALKYNNQDGAACIQIEVFFTPGCVVDGRTYNTVAETPCVGLDRILAWTDSLGIPRVWPMGAPQWTGNARDVGIWNGNAGHYGHCNSPGDDHTDPGPMPDLNREVDDMTPEQAAQLAYIAGPAFKNDMLNTPVEWMGFDGKRQPAGQRNTTTLATVLGWSDAIATGQANLTKAVKDSIPAASGAVDVAALAAQLAPLLNSATADQLLAKIKEQWTK